MAELFRFRCSTCAKLLGVSPRKVGRLVQCPRCQTELIVPSPAEQAEAADLDAAADGTEFQELGIDLGFASPLAIRPSDSSPPASTERPANEVEAIAFLGQIAAAGVAEAPPSLDDFRVTPDPDPDDEDDGPVEEPLIATPAEPLAPRTRKPRARSTRVFEPTLDRRRDVVLPRTAVIAWSMFALLALAFSFVAGLMIGHYRWR